MLFNVPVGISFFGVRHGNAPLFLWMPELGVGAYFSDLIPAVSLEDLNDSPAVQSVYLYTLKGAVNISDFG